MRIVPSTAVLGIAFGCALGCVFDSSGIPLPDPIVPDTPDGPLVDGQHLDANADAPRDQLLHDQPLITQYVDASYDNLSVCPHAP
jgi:hypothetical protein